MIKVRKVSTLALVVALSGAVGLHVTAPAASAALERVEITMGEQLLPGQPTGKIIVASGIARKWPITVSWGDGNVQMARTTCSMRKAINRPGKCRIRLGHVYEQPGIFEIQVKRGKNTLASQVIQVTDPVAEQEAAPAEPEFEISTAWRDYMLSLVNDIRAKSGVAPIGACPRLDKIAQDYAQLMADTGHYGHTGPRGESPWDRYRDGGYEMRGGAENIAYGYPSTETVSRAWEESAGHFRNLINPQLTHIGFGGAVSANGTWYWVQNFGAGGNCDAGGATVHTDAPLRLNAPATGTAQ